MISRAAPVAAPGPFAALPAGLPWAALCYDDPAAPVGRPFARDGALVLTDGCGILYLPGLGSASSSSPASDGCPSARAVERALRVAHTHLASAADLIEFVTHDIVQLTRRPKRTRCSCRGSNPACSICEGTGDGKAWHTWARVESVTIEVGEDRVTVDARRLGRLLAGALAIARPEAVRVGVDGIEQRLVVAGDSWTVVLMGLRYEASLRTWKLS